MSDAEAPENDGCNGAAELVVCPSEPQNNLNCNVESCKGSTRCHR